MTNRKFCIVLALIAGAIVGAIAGAVGWPWFLIIAGVVVFNG